MNPLVQCVRRAREVGCNLPILIPFLAGYESLSDEVRRDLAALDAEVRNVSDLTQKYRGRVPRFHEAYRQWGTINDFGILRFFILNEILGDEPFMFMDNDIVLNASPEEISDAFAGKTFLAQGSTCFGLIHDSSWLSTYTQYAHLLHDDPHAYAKAVNFKGSVEDLLIPVKVDGSDQAIGLALIRAGILKQDSADSRDFMILSSWLHAAARPPLPPTRSWACGR